jgi:hypothetical protein
MQNLLFEKREIINVIKMKNEKNSNMTYYSKRHNLPKTFNLQKYLNMLNKMTINMNSLNNSSCI